MARKAFGLLLLLLMSLYSQDSMLPLVEARVCESQSHGFRGPCFINHNCALLCRNEGFSGGRCRKYGLRCFCTKLC